MRPCLGGRFTDMGKRHPDFVKGGLGIHRPTNSDCAACIQQAMPPFPFANIVGGPSPAVDPTCKKAGEEPEREDSTHYDEERQPDVETVAVKRTTTQFPHGTSPRPGQGTDRMPRRKDLTPERTTIGLVIDTQNRSPEPVDETRIIRQILQCSIRCHAVLRREGVSPFDVVSAFRQIVCNWAVHRQFLSPEHFYDSEWAKETGHMPCRVHAGKE